MFSVLYRCYYREHWYDDYDPIDNPLQAKTLCDAVSAQRGAPAVVRDNSTGAVVYRAG